MTIQWRLHALQTNYALWAAAAKDSSRKVPAKAGKKKPAVESGKTIGLTRRQQEVPGKYAQGSDAEAKQEGSNAEGDDAEQTNPPAKRGGQVCDSELMKFW